MINLTKLNTPEIVDQTKDYILMMLGAPLIKVELDENQIVMCVSRICELMDSTERVAKWSDSLKLMVAQDGALSQAKIILGRIRAKYGFLDIKGVKTKSKSGTKNNAIHFVPMDGNRLLDEGKKEYIIWQKRVFGKINED